MTGFGKNRAASVFCCILALASLRCSTSTDVDEAIFRIDETVKGIDSALSDINSMISALAEPLKIADDCTVEFAAYGLDDPIRFGYIRTSEGSSEKILLPEDPSKNRGVTLVELDPATCRTRNRQLFDTFGAADDILQLMETIESAVAGTIIVGVTADSPDMGGNLDNIAQHLFARHNMNIAELYFREKFAFIMQKGYPKKTIFERKPRYKESIRMKVEISGPSVPEANFTRVSF